MKHRFHKELLCAAALGSLASSCGSQPAPATTAHDGGDADVANDANVPEAAACEPSSDAGEPAPLAAVDLDSAVPLDQAALAGATVRCEYWSHCSPLAAYEVDQCIASLVQNRAWQYTECRPLAFPGATGTQCLSLRITILDSSASLPGPDLVEAVEAGIVTYDPAQEAACLRALRAQPCMGPDPIELLPSCIAAVSCTGDGGTDDAGASDGGPPTCARFAVQGPALRACTSDPDCADIGDAALPAGPYCAGGYCLSRRCDPILDGPDGGCLAPVESGQPCDMDPPRLGATLISNPSSMPSTLPCRAGLTCRGIPADGGLGVCADSQEIGGPCVEGAAVTGCSLGLVCQCGVCRMPPTEGACVDGLCEVGVAYCDSTGTCQPAGGAGAGCTAGDRACATGFRCDSATNTCVPLTSP